MTRYNKAEDDLVKEEINKTVERLPLYQCIKGLESYCLGSSTIQEVIRGHDDFAIRGQLKIVVWLHINIQHRHSYRGMTKMSLIHHFIEVYCEHIRV